MLVYRLPVFALAYNLANSLRRLTLPREIDAWSLITLRERLVKTGTKVVRYAKYITLRLAEVAAPRRLAEVRRVIPAAVPSSRTTARTRQRPVCDRSVSVCPSVLPHGGGP